MKKKYTIENLCCANCAAKMESGINKLENVEASISFLTQRLTIEAPDEAFDEAIEKAEAIIKKIEPDCYIVK